MAEIYINPDAANNDINKLRRAQSLLNESRQSLSQLSSSASSMQGQTVQAITEQAGKLGQQIEQLNGNLTKTMALIQQAVNNYYEFERMEIQRMQGGM